MRAQLQRADVGDDRPPVRCPHLRGVIGHRSKAVRDHVEEVSDRRLPKPIDVECWRMPVAAPHDHAVAESRSPVTRRAENVEALLTSRHDAFIDWKRKARGLFAVFLPGVKERVLLELAARYGTRDRFPRGSAIDK